MPSKSKHFLSINLSVPSLDINNLNQFGKVKIYSDQLPQQGSTFGKLFIYSVLSCSDYLLLRDKKIYSAYLLNESGGIFILSSQPLLQTKYAKDTLSGLDRVFSLSRCYVISRHYWHGGKK